MNGELLKETLGVLASALCLLTAYLGYRVAKMQLAREVTVPNNSSDTLELKKEKETNSGDVSLLMRFLASAFALGVVVLGLWILIRSWPPLLDAVDVIAGISIDVNTSTRILRIPNGYLAEFEVQDGEILRISSGQWHKCSSKTFSVLAEEDAWATTYTPIGVAACTPNAVLKVLSVKKL